jgi:hypothetical protein
MWGNILKSALSIGGNLIAPGIGGMIGGAVGDLANGAIGNNQQQVQETEEQKRQRLLMEEKRKMQSLQQHAMPQTTPTMQNPMQQGIGGLINNFTGM